MIIRKKFRFEGSHIVRNCSSKRCSMSIHGHSFVVELLIRGNKLDAGGMIVDFGLLKQYVGQFIDSFDHATMFWEKDITDYKVDVRKHSDRWIQLPCNVTAEHLAILFHHVINCILHNTLFMNGESGVTVEGVRIHETETGFEQSEVGDIDNDWARLSKIVFSDGIKAEWKYPNWVEDIKKAKKFINPEVNRQVV